MDYAIRNSAADLGRLLPTTTQTEEETRRLGRALAEFLQRGDVVALYGNLGAGKTVLVRGMCAGLDLDPAQITSPTFTIVHEYQGGRLPVYHFDAYRLERIEEFYGFGYEEYFFGDGISVIEWADRIEPLLPDHAIRIRIEHSGGDDRRIVCVEVGTELKSRGRHEPG